MAKGYVDDFLVNRDIFVVFLMAVPMGQGGYGCVAGFGEQVSGGVVSFGGHLCEKQAQV